MCVFETASEKQISKLIILLHEQNALNEVIVKEFTIYSMTIFYKTRIFIFFSIVTS